MPREKKGERKSLQALTLAARKSLECPGEKVLKVSLSNMLHLISLQTSLNFSVFISIHQRS